MKVWSRRLAALSSAAALVAGTGWAAERSRGADSTASDARTDARAAIGTELKLAFRAGVLADGMAEEGFEFCESFVRNYVRAVESGNESVRGMTADELIQRKLIPELQARGLQPAAETDVIVSIKRLIDAEMNPSNTATTEAGGEQK